MERLQTPLKRGTKSYLVKEVSPLLTEALTKVGIHRPKDPFLFLAEYFFERCESREDYLFCKKSQAPTAVSGAREEAGHSCSSEPVGHPVKAARALHREKQQSAKQTPRGPSATESCALLEQSSTSIRQDASDTKEGNAPSQQNSARSSNQDSEENNSPDMESKSIGSTEDATRVNKESSSPGDSDQDSETKPVASSSGDGASLESIISPNDSSLNSQEAQQAIAGSRDQETDSGGRPPFKEAVSRKSAEDHSLGVGCGESAQEAVSAGRSEETENEHDEACGCFRMCKEIDSRYLMCRVETDERKKEFNVDALDISTQGRYTLQCEGVDFGPLKATGKSGLQVAQTLLSELKLKQGEGNSALILCID